MQTIMFTKHLEGMDLPHMADALRSAGLDGADLCVRPGYPVTPENIETMLPEAARRFADAGLSIPLVTAPGDFNRPDIDYAERYLRRRKKEYEEKEQLRQLSLQPAPT